MNLKKSALITGGAKRIGKAIAVFLAEKGFDIALHYNNSKKEAQITQKEIEKTGRRCILFKSNFNNINESSNLIKKVKNKFPTLCILVNNASIFEEGTFLKTKFSQLEKHININFNVPFILSQDFAKSCKKGQIINMLDTNIVRKHSKYFVYNLSKKALYEFTKMAAYELGPNIRVNAIAPGPILPPSDKDDYFLKTNHGKIPLKNKGSVKNIMQAMDYLIKNDFVTGQCLFIDGGRHLI